MDIESVLSCILENLRQQVELHKQLLEIAKLKREAIVQNEIDKLKDFTKQEQLLVFNTIDSEEKREKNVKMLAENFNKNYEELTVSEIIKISRQKLGDIHLLFDIEMVRKELYEVVNELKTVNDLNNQLIKNSIEYLDFNLNLILGSTVQGTYGDSGEETNMALPSRGFDKKY